MPVYLRKSLALRFVSLKNGSAAEAPTASDEIATKLASVRALAAAKEKGSVLVTVCSACHNVLKQTNKAIRENSEFASKVTNYMKPENPYSGETRVIHYLELLRDEIGFDKLSEAVTNPLTG